MRKILVVDDDDLVCEVVKSCFEAWSDTEIECAQRADLGAQKLSAEHFDLVLIDGTLPNFPGPKLAGIAADKGVPVLLISGHPDVNMKLARFGYPYVAKPFTPSQLLAAAEQAITGAAENVRRVKASAAEMRAMTD